jgi:ubiquinone biosynthesis protein UbiJ
MIPAAANAMWGGSDWAKERLLPFAGRTVQVSVWPAPPFSLRVAADGSWDAANLEPGQEADVRLRFSPALLPQLASAPDKPGSALDGDGDPEFLQALRDLGDVLPLAFEERLSSLVGPIAAHGIASSVRALAAWPAIAADRINAGFGAYLTEESQALLKKSALASFAAEVAALSARADRIGDSPPAAGSPTPQG